MKQESNRRPRTLTIIQNLPVPFDRRVWLECQALVENGYDVTVVCPKGKGDPKHAVINDVEVFKYRPYAPGGSAISFVLEYAYSFIATLWLVLKARRKGKFDVLQACNPPDIFFPIGWLLKRLDGTKYVFDHHDLCPELFESRFPDGKSIAHRGLLALEKATFKTADHVCSTNESYREIAIRRGGKKPTDVTVVRTGPNADVLKRAAEVPERRRGRDHLVTYIGVMGPQDGVDLAVRAAAYVVKELGREDISFTFMGKGDSYDELVALRDELGIKDYLELPGRVSDEFVGEVMSTADLGLSPDPKNPLNDLSTMNKTMEYMAFNLPVVAFDLKETKVSAADAAVYVDSGDIPAYAQAIVDLVDDPETRRQMGDRGRARIEEELGWTYSRVRYVAVYDQLLDRLPITDGAITKTMSS